MRYIHAILIKESRTGASKLWKFVEIVKDYRDLPAIRIITAQVAEAMGLPHYHKTLALPSMQSIGKVEAALTIHWNEDVRIRFAREIL